MSWNENTGTPSHIDGQLTPKGFLKKGETPNAAAVRFLAANTNLFFLDKPASELRHVETRTDERGAPHVIFDRTYKGLTVWNNRLVLHFLPDGSIDGVSGGYLSSFDMDVRPSITSQQASELVQKDAGALWKAEVDSELIIYPETPDFRLAWKKVVTTRDFPRMLYLIDAHNGEVILKDPGVRP